MARRKMLAQAPRSDANHLDVLAVGRKCEEIMRIAGEHRSAWFSECDNESIDG